MKKTTLPTKDGSLFIRHTDPAPGKPAILFVHGLGDSGLCYQEVFSHSMFHSCHLVAPDLMGYGQSSASSTKDYSFATQIKHLWHVVNHFSLQEFILVGHSMGADLATLMAAWDQTGRIKKVLLIEGDLTPHDAFISKHAVAAAKQGRFEDWFTKEFIPQTVVREWGRKRPSCKRYAESLKLCKPEAFLANAREAMQRTPLPLNGAENEIASAYRSIKVPKVFCWGGESLPQETKLYLAEMGLSHKGFAKAGHWVMIDEAEEFYSFLYDFVKNVLTN